MAWQHFPGKAPVEAGAGFILTVRACRCSLAIALALTQGAYGADDQCNGEYTPATGFYDFTDRVDRWGQAQRDYGVLNHERIGHIHINSLPIFNLEDDEEDIALFRVANRLHAMTRPTVIRDLLLFEEGDSLDPGHLSESERILREQSYLGDAAIRTVTRCKDVVDVEVITREAWTLVPEVKLKTAGGKTEAGLGFHDSNFLGSGSRVSVSFQQDSERDRLLLHYDDTNLRGTRVALRSHLEENSDGFVRDIGVSLPFYELDAKRSWGVSTLQSKETRYQYALGERTGAIDVERESASAWRGFSPGLIDGVTRRYTFGLTFDQSRFRPSAEGPVPNAVPADLRLGYPWFEYGEIENEYSLAFNINQINRTEDVHIGRRLRARFGYDAGERPNLVFSGSAGDTFISRAEHLLQAAVDWDGRLDLSSGRLADTRVEFGLDYYRGQTDTRSLYLGISAVHTWNLSPEKQVVLGGATGLRGYPAHFATGENSYLFTAEERLYTNQTLFTLFNIGYVAFVDVGRTLGGIHEAADTGLLADVGVGVRFVPNKTDKDHVIHLDVVWPLRRFETASGPQFLVEVKKSL